MCNIIITEYTTIYFILIFRHLELFQFLHIMKQGTWNIIVKIFSEILIPFSYIYICRNGNGGTYNRHMFFFNSCCQTGFQYVVLVIRPTNNIEEFQFLLTIRRYSQFALGMFVLLVMYL